MVFVVCVLMGNLIWYGLLIKDIVLNDKVVFESIVNGVGINIFLVIYVLKYFFIVWSYC